MTKPKKEILVLDGHEVTVSNPEKIIAGRGDAHAGIDAVVGSLDKLLALADRHEAEGLPDAPWPPHHAKGEDEAPRVSPSRAKGAVKAAKPKLPVITIAQATDKARGARRARAVVTLAARAVR